MRGGAGAPSHYGSGRRLLARLAGSPARAAAVEAVITGRPGDAEPDEADIIAAEHSAEDAAAAEAVERAGIRRDALAALVAGDAPRAVAALRRLPPRELAPLAVALHGLGRRHRGAA